MHTIGLYLIPSTSFFHFWMPCPCLLCLLPMASTSDPLQKPGARTAWESGSFLGGAVVGLGQRPAGAQDESPALCLELGQSLRCNLHLMACHGVRPRLGLCLTWLPGVASFCSLSCLSSLIPSTPTDFPWGAGYLKILACKSSHPSPFLGDPDLR